MSNAVPTPTGQSIEILTRRELANSLKCSLRHLDKIQQGGCPCLFLGRTRRFILSEVVAWLKRKGGR